MGITLPRFRYHDHAHCQGFAAPISDNGYEWVSRSQVYRANEDDSTNVRNQIILVLILSKSQIFLNKQIRF